jgi:hypothetical protein
MPEVPWDEDSEGNVLLCPLIGAVVADLAACTVLLRLEYESRSDTAATAAVQLAIRPEEAIQFAKLLIETAERIFAQGRPKKPN